MGSRYATYPYKLFLAVAILAGLASIVIARDKSFATDSQAALGTEEPFLAENTTAMNKMMSGMAIKPTGNIDHDFVAMMVPHHQGAIDMAQAELVYGHNQKLQRISQEIVVEQLQEIAAMRLAIGEPTTPTWVTNAPDAVAPSATRANSKTEAPYLAQNVVAMNTMMTNMAVKPTGDVDYDFVAMMVPHHQGAIDMAQAELRFGYNQQLKTIAQEIIVDQEQEITLMKLALGEPLPPPTSSPTQVSTLQIPPSPKPNSAGAMNSMQMSPSGINMNPITSTSPTTK